MEYRHLGKSGLKVSELTYGNWITHGSQVEEDAAKECVAAALDEGITSFDTADTYAGTRAEEVLGRALAGQRRESVEIFTKVFWPTGPGQNDRGLSRKHILESINGSLRRLGTDYVDLYQAHRYDHETPLEETLRAFEDVVRQGKALYIGVLEWRGEEIAAALRLADEKHFDPVRAPHRPGRADRQVPAGPGPAGQLAGHRREERQGLHQPLDARRPADQGAGAEAAGRRGRAVHGRPGRGLDPAEPRRVLGHHRRHPARPGPGERQGGRGQAGFRAA